MRDDGRRSVSGRALAGRWSALVAAVGLLHLCGRGALARPSLGLLRPGKGAPGPRPAVDTAMAVIRLAAMGAGGYLLLIVTVALIGRGLRHRPTLVLASRLTPPGLRGLLALATTAGIAVVVVSPIAEAVGSPPPVATPPTLHWTGPAPAPPAGPPILRWTGPASAPLPVLPRIGPPMAHPAAPSPRAAPGPGPRAPRDAPDPRRVRTPAGRPRPAAPRPVRRAAPAPVRRAAPAPAEPSGYLVRPGDSFWSIAATRVGAGGPEAQTDDERVAYYWRLLVQANLHNLPVPGQPDLLFPGDRIVVPPVP